MMVGAVLKEVDVQALEKHAAIGIAVHAIEAAKRADLHCSGACQVGYIEKAANGCYLLEAHHISAFEKVSSEIYDELREQLTKRISSSLSSIELDVIEIED